ncbi:MAG TPA: DUF262 domain-containing protein [Methylovirgula sp.]|jgi:hypothetical protein|nr:DUF262 domain-containing protein [Methylovirgula sp.]
MLKDEIDEAKRSVNTDSVQITVGEIANMYANNELNIMPEFQRLFRWTPDRKSSFVESILIGIPIPPAFAYENENGTWELIDGLQRISTILEFMGLLRDPQTGEKKRSQLIKTKYLPSLEGVVWEASETPTTQNIFERPDENIEDSLELPQADFVSDAEASGIDSPRQQHELDKALQLFFRRHRIDFQILKYPSDPKTKFDLFQRLNRGGAYANEQEVRTCSMVLANPAFTAKLREFARREDFQRIFQVTASQRENQKDLEYAVRVVAHTYEEFERGRDVQEFLDQAIIKVMTERDPNEVLETVGWPISQLRRLLGDGALTPPEENSLGIARRFSLRALEGIVVGLARNKKDIEKLHDMDSFIRERVASFWSQPEIPLMAAPGLRGTVRLQRSVSFGARWFAPDART